MMVPRTVVLVIVLVVLLALPAMAQNVRMNATGGAFATTSVDETASFNNPAGLPLLDTFGMNLSPWPSRASANILVDGPDDLDAFSAFYAGRAADNSYGWGAGYISTDNGADSDAFSVGYGHNLDNGFTVGASLYHESWETAADDGDSTSFDLGAMYRRALPLNTWRAGLWLEDVADEYGGPFFHAGAAVELPAGVDVAASIFDITDEVDTVVASGAEWSVPLTSLIVRAGSNDGDFSAGLGYRWTNFEVGLAWSEAEGDDQILAGVTGCF